MYEYQDHCTTIILKSTHTSCPRFIHTQRGIQQRQTAATLCNKNSSRSHSIFTLKIMIKECNVDGEEVVRHGQLNLVGTYVFSRLL